MLNDLIVKKMLNYIPVFKPNDKLPSFIGIIYTLLILWNFVMIPLFICFDADFNYYDHPNDKFIQFNY